MYFVRLSHVVVAVVVAIVVAVVVAVDVINILIFTIKITIHYKGDICCNNNLNFIDPMNIVSAGFWISNFFIILQPTTMYFLILRLNKTILCLQFHNFIITLIYCLFCNFYQRKNLIV